MILRESGRCEGLGPRLALTRAFGTPWADRMPQRPKPSPPPARNFYGSFPQRFLSCPLFRLTPQEGKNYFQKLIHMVFTPSSRGARFGAILFCLGHLAVCHGRADTIAFFYALDSDFQALKREAQPVGQPLKVGTRSIAALQISAHRVYAVKMGSGAVETATSVQALLARVRCDAAFSVGPVGGLSDKLKAGSWSRVAEVVCYQKGSWTKTGFQLSPSSVVSLRSNALDTVSLPEPFRALGTIKVASGEVFIASDSYRTQLRESTGADAVDMNLFGLVTVCADYRLPLVCWRVVSDRADDNASENFRRFVAGYDGAGGKAVAQIIKTLPVNPNSPMAYPNLQKALSK